MPRKEFHNQPYDAGTLTKLEIFELYVKAWIPVFLAREIPSFEELHIFDFFCGPGTDSNGVRGSPLRILQQLQDYERAALAGWPKVSKHVHFSDIDTSKIAQLAKTVSSLDLDTPGVQLRIESQSFDEALEANNKILNNPRAAKLLIIDQFGVDAVSDSVFAKLIQYPRTDFIFFLSTSTLHRFRDHPAIKQKIEHPDDSYHVHRAAHAYFRAQIPQSAEVYLGQFSIRKKTNIYGLIFGSQHPLGIHKFLEVAWKNDQIAGEANFDVDRENIGSDELVFDFDELKPKKIQSFETALKAAFIEKRFFHEFEIIKFCIDAGMTAQHSKRIISELKKEQRIACDFQIPNIRNLKAPREIKYL